MKNHSAFFYIIIALALVAVAGLVFLLAPGSQPDTPAVVLPTPAATDAAPESAAPANEGAVTVTPDNVQVVIATLHRIDSYSRTLSIRDYWSGGSRSRSIDVWAHGGDLRLATHSEGSSTVEHLLLRGDDKYIWYSDADGVYTGTVSEGDEDAYQTILTYEKVLSLPRENILDAGYADFNGLSCIYVRCRMGTMGYVSECWIDPGSGLLMCEQCRDGEELIYTMESTVPDVSTPDDSVFAVP